VARAVRAELLHRQYRSSLVLVVTVLVLTALVCSATVIWAGAYIRTSNERVTGLELARVEVLQDMTEAETGVRGYILGGGDAGSRQRYDSAMYWLPIDEQELRQLAVGDDGLVAAVDELRRAQDAWIREYASVRIGGESRGVRGSFHVGARCSGR
jgi:CHASE3 domain sensor protein